MKPSKEQVREWLKEQSLPKKKLPSLEEVRRSLGWDIIAAQRKKSLR